MTSKYKINDPDGIYFITFATVGWIDVFTRKDYKDIVVNSLQFCQEEKGLIIYSWCIMSNHVHLIVRSSVGDLSGTIRDLKSFTSKQILKSISAHPKESRREWMLELFKKYGAKNSNNKTFQFWQQDNHPKELITNHFKDQKCDYIHQNPVKAGIVANAEDYLYSSARSYAGLDALLDIEMI